MEWNPNFNSAEMNVLINLQSEADMRLTENVSLSTYNLYFCLEPYSFVAIILRTNDTAIHHVMIRFIISTLKWWYALCGCLWFNESMNVVCV